MRPSRHVLPALLLTAPLIALAGCGARASASAADRPAVAVAVAPAAAPSSEALYEGPASVIANRTYQLAFEIPGRVVRVNADVGGRVSQSSVLAELDPSDYVAQLGEARARAASASAQLSKAIAGARPQERAEAQESVSSARAALDRARAGATLADADERRMATLFQSGAISAQQADTAMTNARDAEDRVTAAQAELRRAQEAATLVDEGTRREDIAAARAEASAASSAAALASLTLAKTRLVAPRDAVVEQRAIEPGDQATPGTVVFTLLDAAAPDVLLPIPERVAPQVRAGMPATVFADGRRIAARVTRIEPGADTATRSATIRLRVDTALRPGAIVEVSLGDRAARGASVPPGAIVDQGDAAAVALYRGDTQSVEFHRVRMLGNDGERVRVEGIRPGELIVVAGAQEVHQGDRVRVVDGGPPR